MGNSSSKSVVNENRAQEVRNDMDKKVNVKYDENAPNIYDLFNVDRMQTMSTINK